MSYLLVSLMLVVGILPMAFEAIAGKFDPFNLKNAFISFYLMQLAISGIPAIYTGEASIYGPNPILEIDYYEWSLLASTLGLIVFQAAYYLTTLCMPLPMRMRYEWRRFRVGGLMFLLIGLGYAGIALIVMLNGGLTEFLTYREYWRSEGIKGQGFLTFAVKLPELGVLLWMVRKGPDLRFGWRFVGLVAIALVPAFIMGFRQNIVFPILDFAVLWHYAVRRISMARLTVIAVFLGSMFTAYGAWRIIPPGVEIDADIAMRALSDPEVALGLVIRNRGTEVVASTIKRLHEFGGYQFVTPAIKEALSIPIPRALWEGKPKAASERFTTFFFGYEMAKERDDFSREDWGGIAPTVIGEMYWHAAGFGIFFGMLFLGIFVRMVYNTLTANRQSKSMLLVYPILFNHVLGFAEAPQGYVNSLVLYFFAFAFIFFVLTKKVWPNPAVQSAA